MVTYLTVLIASFALMYMLSELSLIIIFSAYVEITSVFFVQGGFFFVEETLNIVKLIAVLLISTATIIGVSADE